MAELLEGDIWRAGYLLKNASQFEFLEVAYTSVLADARGEARRIAGFLGGGLDVEKMAGVVDRQLYRNRAENGSAV